MSDMDDSFVGKFRGFLFKNRFAKTDRHPTWTGRVVFTIEQIRRLTKRADGKNDNAEIVCDAAAWTRVDKNGDNYIFISTDADNEPKSSASAGSGSSSREDIPF